MSFPFTDLTTKEQIITEAAKHEITLLTSDFTDDAVYGLCLDGMPAAQWLEAMTMD